jgi:hypothetical protein
MKKSHCLLRTGLATFGVKSRKVGVARAYVARAMEYGMDAAWVDVTRHYGESPADPTLLKVIDGFAEADGSAQKMKIAKEVMTKLSGGPQKPPQKP